MSADEYGVRACAADRLQVDVSFDSGNGTVCGNYLIK